MRTSLAHIMTLLALGLVAISAQVHAGAAATFQTGADASAPQATLEYSDDAQMRMGVPGQPGSYILVRDNNAYIVSQPSQGSAVVMDLGAMVKMMGESWSESVNSVQSAPEGMTTFVSLEDTGRNETVAGIRGDVFILTYKDEQGNTQSDELVLTRDDDVREMTVALFQMGQQMGAALGAEDASGNDEFHREMAAQQRGVLRMGSSFRLVEIDSKGPGAGRFDLPAQPMAMPDLGSVFGGAGAGQAGVEPASTQEASDGSWGSALGGLFGKKSERQKGRVEERVDEAVDETTDKAVDKVLDKAFGKIFGR